ncbi:MAG: hypothetical protein HXX11_17645 [Desulfuromonadales bacterium]|nr:hypothetical protein [Desulfuromonadales bacterium]
MDFSGKHLTYFHAILAVFISVSVVSIAHGQPVVSGLSGTISHSSSVTISGSGFGSKTSASPLAFGDMENNSLNARIGSWTQTGYPSGVLSVSSLHPRNANSTYSAVCNFNMQNEFCAFQQQNSSTTWYAQYWVYLDSAFNWGDANIKLFRLWANSSGTENLRVQSYNRVDVNVEGADEGHGGYGKGWNPVVPGTACSDLVFGHSCNTSDWLPGSLEWRNFQSDVGKGIWHLFQFEYQDGSPNTANGVLRWWVDGKQVFNRTDVTTRTDSRTKFLQVLGFYRDALADGSGLVYLDDLYVDTTWQRIEIGNNSNYNNCTLREIQPPTVWSDSSITFKVNQGSFANGSTGYIFVTDASGTRNTGSTVTFGSSGGGTPDATPPTSSVSPAAGAYASSQTINLSCTDNTACANTYYCWGSSCTPTSLYSVPITIQANTLRYYSTDTLSNSESVKSSAYTITSTPLNGSCGSSNSLSLTSAPTTNLCTQGTASTVSGSGPWTWSCGGSNGGSTASCTAYLLITPVNGSCGGSNGLSLSSAPTTNLCTQGTASSVSGSGPWSWTCNGSNGGSASSCSASLASSGTVTVARNECTNPPSGTVFCEDFEGTNPKANFNDYDGNPDTENLIATDSGPAGVSSNKAVKLWVAANQDGSSDLVKVLPTTYDKLYARWYFKFEPGFNFNNYNHGGGLTAGDRSYIGLSGNRPAGNDFASFLMQPWSSNDTEPFSYTYYRGMYQNCADPNGSCWGDSFPCVYDSGSTSCTKPADRPTVTMPTLVTGQWYCYEQMIDMGTASTNGVTPAPTGRITQWLNGTQFGDNTNLWFRTTANLKLQNLWLALFENNNSHSASGELIDNVVVSTQRIGCGGTVALSPVGNLRPTQIIP